MTFAPGTLGRPCKVAVCLDTGDWDIVGTSATWAGADAIPVPAHLSGRVTFATVEGMAEELARDTYEIGYFEGAPAPKEDSL